MADSNARSSGLLLPRETTIAIATSITLHSARLALIWTLAIETAIENATMIESEIGTAGSRSAIESGTMMTEHHDTTIVAAAMTTIRETTIALATSPRRLSSSRRSRIRDPLPPPLL